MFNFAVGLVERLSKDILLDSFTITTTKKEQQPMLGLPRIWAQASHIWLWLVVSREAYGDCLRFFVFK